MTEQVQEKTTVEGDDGEVVVSQWEFIGKVPTAEDVRALLASVPAVFGVHALDFIEYVQPLPQRKKLKRPHPDRPGVLVDEHVDCYTLYMSVAGRIKMLQAAQEEHGWVVGTRPEPTTPTGLPGYLNITQRLVYRVYVEIEGIGFRHGTAWVPESGGSNAAGSNPYEKVETSALGRALGAWGFGVLPGSGVASLEEMAGVKQNRAYMDAERSTGARPGSEGGSNRRPRAELLTEALTLGEQVRVKRGFDDDKWVQGLASYLATKLGVANPIDPNTGLINWDAVKDGQLLLVSNYHREMLKRLADIDSEV